MVLLVADGMATAGWHINVADVIALGLILFQFEFWGIKQNLIPDVRQFCLTP